MKTKASQERLRDKTQPHFSLKEMKAIPPYKGPKRVFAELMDEVSLKTHHFRREVWNTSIELIADHLGLMKNPWKYSLPNLKWQGPVGKPACSGFQELKPQIEKTGLIEHFIKEARESPGDYFGDIFTEEELAGKKNGLGQNLTPMSIVEFMIKMVGIVDDKEPLKPDPTTEAWLGVEGLAFENRLPSIGHVVEQARLRRVYNVEPVWEKYVVRPKTVADPAGCGTGRFLLGANWMTKKPIVLFGIEIDVSLYRACLVNMALYAKYPYTIVCADALMIDGRYSDPASKLWDYGNQWNPPDLSMFLYKSTPPFKFSLKDLANAVKPVKAKPEIITLRESPAFSLAQLLKAKKKQP